MATPRRSTTRPRPRTSRAGCDGRAVRREARRRDTGCVDPPAGLVGVEPAVSSSPKPQRARTRRPRPARARAAPALRARVSAPPLWKSRVDALGGGDAPHLVDGRVHGPLQGDRAVAAVRARPSASRARRRTTREHQPPLRPEAPKPAISRSSDHHAQRRVGLLEVVRGPEPGEAGADDGHVDVGAGRAGRVAGRGRRGPRRARDCRSDSPSWSPREPGVRGQP